LNRFTKRWLLPTATKLAQFVSNQDPSLLATQPTPLSLIPWFCCT